MGKGERDDSVEKMNMSDLTHWISSQQANVQRDLLRKPYPNRRMRTRPRDPDEIKILDQLCIKRWKKAEAEGKIRYLSERVWYYEFD